MNKNMQQQALPRLSDTRVGYNNPQFLVYVFLFEDLRQAIAAHARGDVLDIGCGNKPYKPLFDGITNSYTGCDIAQSDKNQVDIICPATSIPLPDACMDTVFSTQVIEHVADHNKLLSEAYRILRPGGKAIISGPMYWEHHEEPYDFFRFTRYGFQHIFEQAGFKNITIKANGGKWALTGQMLQNNIRSTFTGKKSMLRSLLKGFYFAFRLKWLINFIFYRLDKHDPDYSTTLNYVVVAQK